MGNRIFFILQGLLLICSAKLCYGQTTTNFSCAKQATLGSPFSITCHITGTLSNGINWLRPSGASKLVVSCSGPDTADCVPAISGYNVPFANTTVIILDITSFSANDEGSWTCRDGTVGSAGCEISSSVSPTDSVSSVKVSPDRNLKDGDTLTITVVVSQYYCSQAVSFKVSLNGQLLSLPNMPASNSQFVNGSDAVTTQVTNAMAGPIKLLMTCGTNTFEVLQGLGNLTIETPTTPEACRCLCHCDRKTRDIVLLIIEIIILVVILVFLVFNILIGKQVIKCNSKKGAQEHANSKKGAQEHANSKKGAQEHANKISVIICILILVVAAIYGIICVAVTQTEPTIQNAAAVSGQECCCSTCDDNGGDEKKRCEDIATTVLAFGIILIFGAVVLIIAVLILTKIKDLPWINNFLFICGCGCCSSPVPPPNEPGNKDQVNHNDDAAVELTSKDSTPSTGGQPASKDPKSPKNGANSGGAPASNVPAPSRNKSDLSTSNVNVSTGSTGK